jgi:hypothetical protein
VGLCHGVAPVGGGGGEARTEDVRRLLIDCCWGFSLSQVHRVGLLRSSFDCMHQSIGLVMHPLCHPEGSRARGVGGAGGEYACSPLPVGGVGGWEMDV